MKTNHKKSFDTHPDCPKLAMSKQQQRGYTMKALFQITVKDKNGQNLIVSLDSDKALQAAELTLIRAGIEYAVDITVAALYGASEKQQAEMLDTIKFWQA